MAKKKKNTPRAKKETEADVLWGPRHSHTPVEKMKKKTNERHNEMEIAESDSKEAEEGSRCEVEVRIPPLSQ